MVSPAKGKTKVCLSLDTSELTWLREYAEMEGRSVSGQINVLIRRLRQEVEGRSDT